MRPDFWERARRCKHARRPVATPPSNALFYQSSMVISMWKWQSHSFVQNLVLILQIQYCLDLRKPDLRKNLDLRKIVATTDFLVHKLFGLRKIF